MVKKSDIKPFVYATVTAARVVAESSKTSDGLGDVDGNIEVAESGQIQIKWEVDQEGNALALTVSPHLEYEIAISGQNALDYTCDFEVNFDVNEIHGFKAKDGLPQPAAAPYVDFAVFLARQHAAKSIRSAGVSRFAFAEAVRSKDLPYQKMDPGTVEQSSHPSVKSAVKSDS